MRSSSEKATPTCTTHRAPGSLLGHSSRSTLPWSTCWITPWNLRLRDHLSRLDKLTDSQAAEAFFDFRIADIAMGSGHFLVAAVDRIERVLSGYLAKRTLKGVHKELARLRAVAAEALGPIAEGITIEDTQILRRQIARRCIYGVDLNPISVELARLALWIHTFVPGLPLSFLDHSLAQGNSLIGIATIEEANDALKEFSLPLFAFSRRNWWEQLKPLSNG